MHLATPNVESMRKAEDIHLDPHRRRLLLLSARVGEAQVLTAAHDGVGIAAYVRIMVAQLMLRGFRHPTNRLDEILNRPLHVAEERVGEAIEMMIPDIRTCMASEPAEEVNEKLPAVVGLLIGVGMHWPHLPGCMYSLGKHALGRLKRVLAQTDLTVDLMQEAVAGQRAMTLPGFAFVVLAVEPCAQLLLVAIVQARLVALVARRRADGVGVGDLIGHEASSTVLLDGATDALDSAVGGPCCASA